MNLDRIPAEFTYFTGNPVVPTCPDGHDEITVHDCFVGIGGSMHTKHAHGKRMVFRESPLAKQGGGDRCLKFFGESNDLP